MNELIARAERVRKWLQSAAACGCESLDVCALFAQDDPLPPEGIRVVSVGANRRA